MSNTLLQKYNRAVPRYTSYPPANLFHSEYSPTQYIEDLKKSNEWSPRATSLYVHIPFCERICYFCGCNKNPKAKPEKIELYLQALKKEITMVAPLIDKTRPVTQLHYGGGTPNAIPAEMPDEINTLLFKEFSFATDAEIAIECNPAYLDEEYITKLKNAGFNRFSLGIQDFDKKVLDGVNRLPSQLPMAEIIRLLKEDNPKIGVNLDFIYGLPHQTATSFLQTIQQAIDLQPDRLVTFSYAHVPWVNKLQEKVAQEGLPSNEEKSQMFAGAVELLQSAGYRSIGMDHFVLPTDTLYQAACHKTLHRNFQGYCTRQSTGQVYAFGVSGISQLQYAYAQNTKSIAEYKQKIDEGILPIVKGYSLNETETMVREVITEILCNMEIHWANLANALHISEETLKNSIGYNEKILSGFREDGLMEFDTHRLKVTNKGLLFIRNIAAIFDPIDYSAGQKFSKVV